MDDLFMAEILAQPAAIERAARALEDQRDQLVRLAARDPATARIVLTGMGASYDACLAAASVLGSHGVLAAAINTAELVHFRLPALGADTLLIAISQSGRSAELVRLALQPAPATLVSITNGLDNPLAAAASVALDTAVGPEFGPSTMTFAGTFPVLDAVVSMITGVPRGDAATAAAAALRLLRSPLDLADEMLGWAGDRSGAVLVGRGTARAAADLGALVLKEAAGFAAECLDAAEFRHGPLELAGPDLAVAVVATEPATFDLDVALAMEVAAHGSPVALLASAPVSAAGLTVIPVEPIARLLMPAVAAIPFHLLAWRLAVAKGRDPGRFTVGTKVTTRE
ncbi:SIS domain-containing protein [Nonomuraea sp. NPDC049152]|uniref:SIS domain-containing protein n=1 Tax=Nonomuraea sp. NPDC049152 TaxID=3154350 RepID=UPI0033F18581